MNEFNPKKDILHNERILDYGEWPNFHGAKMSSLNIWREKAVPGRVRMISIIEASIDLYQSNHPCTVVLKFVDCDAIVMKELNHNNIVHDLMFNFEARGTDLDGDPLPPHVAVNFEEAYGVGLSFKCLSVQAVERRDIARVA